MGSRARGPDDIVMSPEVRERVEQRWDELFPDGLLGAG